MYQNFKMSTAVGNDIISKVVGYRLTAGNFQETSPNLPQRIVIIGEANVANQSTLDNNPTSITSLQQCGQLYGFGSPIYQAMRILRPVQGGGVEGIPTIVIAQDEAPSATAKVLEVTPVGTATGNGTHTLVINGRKEIDGQRFDFSIVTGDTVSAITAKMIDCVNKVLGAVVIGTENGTKTTFTSKWKGLTSNDINITVDTNGAALGMTYAVASTANGAGSPSVASGLELIGNQWATIIINCYGTNTAVMTALESYNGKPSATTPTGRYTGTTFKPFIAITGSTAEDPSSITDARLNELTIAIAPAPLSNGLQLEAAANMGLLFARQAQDNPQLDVSGQSYSDMPTPIVIGSMSTFTNRDSIVKKGCSTVDLVGGKYVVQDFVTTYHPVGELPPQYRYCRNLNIDWNVRYGYFLLEQNNVVDHAIAADQDTVTAQKVIKPKQWKGILDKYATDLSQRALIADVSFMQSSITVNLSNSNPDRLETFFRYKRTGFARISSTTAEAGFNFGTNN